MARLILELVRPYRWVIAIILAAMLTQTAMSLAGPWPLKVILDNVVVAKHPLPRWMTELLPILGGKNKMHIAELAAIFFIVIAVLNAVAAYIANYYTETVGQWVAYDLRTRTYHHLQRLSLSYYDTHQVGAIVSTINDDVDTIQSFASDSITDMLIDALTIVGILGVMVDQVGFRADRRCGDAVLALLRLASQNGGEESDARGAPTSGRHRQIGRASG